MTSNRENIMKFDPKTHLFGYNPDSQILIWMKPSEFLEKTPKLSPKYWRSSSTRAVVNELADKMKKHIPIDPLFLDIDTVNCIVTNHEGRHRAMAAEEAEIGRVPVIIYLMDNNKNRISAKEYMKQVTTANEKQLELSTVLQTASSTKNIGKTTTRCNLFDVQKQE